MLKLQTIHRTQLRICDSIKTDNGVTFPVIAGQCSTVDVVSPNGYRYKRGFWEKVLDNSVVAESIKSRDILGTIEHPEDDDAFLNTPYDEASHCVLKTWIEQGNPFAQFGILNNDKGNALKALLEIGHKPGVSTRGLGSFLEDGESKFVDSHNYAFITWDIVRKPNFSDLKMDKVTDSLMSSPTFKEMTEMFHLKDSVIESYNMEALKRDMQLATESLKRVQSFLITKNI